MALKKAIVVGGYDRHTTKIKKDIGEAFEYVHVPTYSSVDARVMPDAEAVILLTRFASRTNVHSAKTLAKARSIPLVQCETSNYIGTELRRLKLLDPEGKTPESPAKEARKEEEPHPDTKIGLSIEELAATYVSPLIEAVTKLLSPGEKIHELDLLDSMESVIGIPREDIQLLLPEVAMRGIISNTAGQTWLRLGPGYEFVEDKEEVAPTPTKRKRTGKFDKAQKVRGLPEGPYPHLWAIAGEMLKYKDFAKDNGEMPTRQYLNLVAGKAEELGIITEVDGKKLIEHDPSIELTRIQEQPEEAPVEESKSVKKQKKGKRKEKKEPESTQPVEQKQALPEIGTKFVSLATLQAAAAPPPKIDDQRDQAKQIGPIDVPMIQGTINTVKKLLAEPYWDEMAKKSIERRQTRRGIKPFDVPRSFFSRTEWDALAWETIRSMPLEVVATAFLEDLGFQDELRSCRLCGRSFPFTAEEQKRYQRMYGEVIPPSKCPECRREQRNRMKGGDGE